MILSTRSYLKTDDPIMIYIGIAFGLFGISNLGTIAGIMNICEPCLIIIRLFAYLIIIFGIVLTIRLIIDRQRTENKHWESSERYHTLVETVRDWIWEIDENSVYTYANLRVRDILGYEPEEIIGKKPIELMPPDEAGRVSDLLSELVREKKPIISLENINIHKDGHLVTLETSGLPFFSQTGAFAGYRGVDRDITERKQSEWELWQSNEALSRELERRRVIQREFAEERRLFTGGQIVIFKWKAEKGWPVEYVSPNVEELFGYAPREFTSGSILFTSIIHPLDLKRIISETEEYLRQGRITLELEFRICRKDGIWRDLYNYTTIVRDADGTPAHYNCYILDITERKKAEEDLLRKHDELNLAYEQLTASEEELRANYDELRKTESALRESEQKFRGIIDQSFQFIGLMTTDGILIEANRSALQFAGIEEDEVLGKYFWDTPWWTHSSKLQEQLKDAVQKASCGKTVRFEATHLSADGNLAYIDFSLKPVLDPAGQVIYLIPEGRDVTERKKTEEALSESEGRYRQLFESSLDCILLVDADTAHIIDANPAMSILLGKSREDIIGKNLWEAGLFKDPLSAEQAVADMNHMRYLYYDELVLVLPDKRRRIIEFSGSRYLLFEKPVIQYTIRDITDRKQAEETLRLNAERNAALLRLNQMTGASEKELIEFAFEEGIRLTKSKIGCLAEVDEEKEALSMQYWSAAAREQCQISPEPIIYQLRDTGLWSEAIRQRQPVIINDNGSENLFRKGFLQGNVRLTRYMTIPVFAGSKIVLVAVFGNKEQEYDETDVQQLTLLMEGMWHIVERKRAEEEIENSHRRLDRTLQFIESVISAVPTPLFYKDTEGRYIGVNDAFADLMGFTPDFYNGKTVMELWPSEYAEVYHKMDLDLMKSAQKQIYEFKVVDKNGVDHPVIWSKNVFRDENGEVAGIVGAFVDITERKQAEEELQKYQNYLEDLVLQRTSELSDANTKLTQEIRERIAIHEALNKRLVALTKPLESTDIVFSDLFNIEDIQKIQDAFAEANRVASIITLPDGTPITKPSNFCRLCNDIIRKTDKGLQNCRISDAIIGRPTEGGPIIQPCLSGGLWDAGASIIVGGKHIANWLMGQVKNESIEAVA
ncbi:MAG: PAS domain S-box protein [Methanospirillaceae archaeon]|nr:PAS domain S-box protein [Methanospirillaceae archaeon]